MTKRTEDQEVSPVEKHMKRWNLRISIVAGLIGIFGSFMICTSFINKIESNQEKNTESIQKIDQKLEEMNSRLDANDVYRGTSQTEIDNMKSQLDRIENKQDKIMDILLKTSQ